MNPDHQKSHFDLKTLLDTGRMLVESHDPDFVMNNLLLVAMGKLATTRGLILLHDAPGRIYKATKVKGRSGIAENSILPEEALGSLRTSNPAVTRHMLPPALEDAEMIIAMEIRTSEQHIGYLCLGEKLNRKSHSPEEIEFIESLIYMAGAAIGNSLLVRELKQTNRKLDLKVQEMHTLFDLSKEFNATIEKEEIIRIFSFALLGQLMVRTFFLVLKSEQGIESVAQSGIREPAGSAELEKLFHTDESVVRVDDQAGQANPFLKKNEIKLLLHLRFQDNQPVVFGLGHRSGGKEYEEDDFSFLVSLANLALISLHKTFLLEEQLEKKRLEEELNLARTIQLKLLPEEIPLIDRFDLAAVNISSRQVGGDYYDIIENNGQLFLAIADVTGKGFPASLLMANLQAMLQVIVPLDISLSNATEEINNIIFSNTPPDKFISFFWGRLEIDSATFRYVNAGHNPPLLFRGKGGKRHELSEGGVLLGAMPTMVPYEEGRVTLEKDDVLILYTDGVTEAMNDLQEEYAENRLVRLVEENRQLNAGSILSGIVQDVKEFAGNRLGDDLTLMVLKIN